MSLIEKNIKIGNPFYNFYDHKTNVILYAHDLIGTTRGKSANGLMMHSKLFNVVAIIDNTAVGQDTSKVCQGVDIKVPVYRNITEALENHQAKAVIFLISPTYRWYEDIEIAVKNGLDLINTSFDLIKTNLYLTGLVRKYNVKFFDLRDVTDQQAYPNINILNRKSKVVFVTGTDCGLGKRTAAYELTQKAIEKGINAVMYATGQTGLMLGERGTVIDSLVVEFSNGIVSQHVNQLSELGYELIFVEGQSDIFHPGNSAMSLALLHGANPDCIVLVHDEFRKVHKGFEEDSPLYKLHPLRKYIDAHEILTLPCGPLYKTIAIATIGNENIEKIKKLRGLDDVEIADVKLPGGAEKILNKITKYLKMDTKKSPMEELANIML